MKSYLQRNLQKFATVIMALLSAMDQDIGNLETAIGNKKAVVDINPSAETIENYIDGSMWLEVDE